MAEPRREANVACGDSRTNAGSKDEKAAELRPKEIDSALAWEFPAVAAPQLYGGGGSGYVWLAPHATIASLRCFAAVVAHALLDSEPCDTSGPIAFRRPVETLLQPFPTINVVVL